MFSRDELEELGPPLSTREVRLATILRELPFTISFSQRVMVFQNLIYKDKADHQGNQVNFLLKSAFDPNRGFFTLTKDQML